MKSPEIAKLAPVDRLVESVAGDHASLGVTLPDPADRFPPGEAVPVQENRHDRRRIAPRVDSPSELRGNTLRNRDIL